MYLMPGGINDRAFLDNVVTQVIVFEGDGKLYENAGGYADWIEARSRMQAAQSVQKKADATAPAVERRQPERNRKPKLSWNEEKELARLPDEIAALEQELADLQHALADPALYRGSPEKAREFQARITAAEETLLQRFARWEELEAKQASTQSS